MSESITKSVFALAISIILVAFSAMVVRCTEATNITFRDAAIRGCSMTSRGLTVKMVCPQTQNQAVAGGIAHE